MGRTKIFREVGATNNALAYKMCDKNSRKQTNADRIRSMTDIELSTDLIPLIMEVCEDGVPCEALFLEWLQSEADTKGE